MNKICPECGVEIKKGYKFCGKCGYKFTQEIPITMDTPLQEEVVEKIREKPKSKSIIVKIGLFFGIVIIVAIIFFLIISQGDKGGIITSEPSADFDYSISDTSVTFSDTSTDADGRISSCYWNFGDGYTSYSKNPTHRYSNDGTYEITLKITDDDGNTNTISKKVTITIPKIPPTAKFTYTTSGLMVSFTSTSSDSDGTISSHYWTFGDGTSSYSKNPTNTYSTSGTYQVTLKVTDDDRNTDTYSKKVTILISNAPPSVYCSSYPIEGTKPLTVSFYSSAHDNDGYIKSYYWDFGDDEISTSEKPIHTYYNIGTYSATLTVTDNYGGTGSDSITIVVYDETERVDSDNDGCPDDIDIFDNGNAGIRVHISFYQDDGTMDKYFFAPDPYFEIIINLRDKDGNPTPGDWKMSQVFDDGRTLYDPFSFTIDVDEDITKVGVQITAWDDDTLDPDDPIDLSAKSSDMVSRYEFNPRLNNYKSNIDDGSLDLIDDEFDARIVYTIEIVEI